MIMIMDSMTQDHESEDCSPIQSISRIYIHSLNSVCIWEAGSFVARAHDESKDKSRSGNRILKVTHQFSNR